MTDFNNDDKALIGAEDIVKMKKAKRFLILGWVFAVMSFIILPIVFGPLGIFFGHLTRKNGKEKEGKTLMIASAVIMVVSMILGFIFILMANRFN